MTILAVVSLVILSIVVFAEPDRRLLLDDGENTVNVLSEIAALKQQVKLQGEEINRLQQRQQTIGTTYVRWGRTNCDGNGTSTVYSGYMAGTYMPGNNGGGSGHNYLCLASQPIWGHYTDTPDNDIAITGVEYVFWYHRNTDLSDFLGDNIHYGDEAPCAVCHAQRGASVMIPGRTECYPGWTEEYDGYLVTGYPGYDDSTEYACLDRRPESVVGSGTAHIKNNLYFVEAECGFDLQCPPYVHGREISCVVCSK